MADVATNDDRALNSHEDDKVCSANVTSDEMYAELPYDVDSGEHNGTATDSCKSEPNNSSCFEVCSAILLHKIVLHYIITSQFALVLKFAIFRASINTVDLF